MPANSFQSFASTPFYKPRAMFPRHFHLIRKFLFRLNENALQGCVLEQSRNLPLKRTRPARKLLGQRSLFCKWTCPNIRRICDRRSLDKTIRWAIGIFYINIQVGACIAGGKKYMVCGSDSEPFKLGCEPFFIVSGSGKIFFHNMAVNDNGGRDCLGRHCHGKIRWCYRTAVRLW